jgi:predicted Fe-Mo cluster-binding NifX family protein
MRIAISATGTNLDADVDPRFGRCPYFIIIDSEAKKIEVVPNEYAMAGGGAGISTAQMVANMGVDVVLTGNVGPNAYQVLGAAGIQVVTGVSGKVKDALEAFKRGEYQLASEPTVDAHFGMGFGPGAGCGMGRGMGRGIGRGMGMGMGRGMGRGVGLGREEEVKALKEQAKILEQQLQEINRRLQDLEKDKDK